MKIAALLLTAVLVLNSVDASSQSSSSSRRSGQASRPLSPPSREPSAPRPGLPYLPQGSRIIRGVRFPHGIYYRVGPDRFSGLVLYYDAVLNYEKKIVGVFLQTHDNMLFGLYYGRGGSRIKLNPACMDRGPEHYDYLDTAGDHYYPEFAHFQKPNEMIIESFDAYKRMGIGLSCSHTSRGRQLYLDLPAGSHIVRDVEFPQGFFFKLDYEDHRLYPLMLHKCEVVVDIYGMIIAAFLGPSEYRLLGIYRGEGGPRVKLAHPTMEAAYANLDDEEINEFYVEFMEYHKPPGIYRGSLADCG